MKVSDVVRDFFEEKGVDAIFLLSGGMIMHLLDSVSKSHKIRYFCNHHEQASAIAAEGYARSRNSIGVCYATSGPGATNTLTGIAGAWLDSVPLMVITGQSRTALTVRGTGIKDLRMMGNFEVDIVAMAKPVTKYAAFVDNANEIRFHLEKAFFMATSGRPGPVLLEIPLDIQGGNVEESDLIHFTPVQEGSHVDQQKFSELEHSLRESKRPVILAGHGIRVADQVQRFRNLVHKLKIPVVTTQLANDVVPYADELYIGKVGLRGDRAGNFCVQSADLVIGLGCSFHITTTGYELEDFAPNAQKVIVDLDQANLAKNQGISSFQIRADINSALAAIEKFSMQENRTWNDWRNKLSLWKESFKMTKEPHPIDSRYLSTYEIIDSLSAVLLGEETIVTDAGSLYYIVGQAFRTKEKQRVIVSGALGAMGYALPAAIGASVATPERTVICLTGDGSMQTNVQELQTVATYQLNCKIIVINNKGYASIRNSQTSFQGGNVAASSEATGVQFPDWKLLASAYHIPYLNVTEKSDLDRMLRQLIAVPGPQFLEIVIPENVTMLPAVTSKQIANGQFKSNRLHEMSPELPGQRLKELGITC